MGESETKVQIVLYLYTLRLFSLSPLYSHYIHTCNEDVRWIIPFKKFGMVSLKSKWIKGQMNIFVTPFLSFMIIFLSISQDIAVYINIESSTWRFNLWLNQLYYKDSRFYLLCLISEALGPVITTSVT